MIFVNGGAVSSSTTTVLDIRLKIYGEITLLYFSITFTLWGLSLPQTVPYQSHGIVFVRPPTAQRMIPCPPSKGENKPMNKPSDYSGSRSLRETSLDFEYSRTNSCA